MHAINNLAKIIKYEKNVWMISIKKWLKQESKNLKPEINLN